MKVWCDKSFWIKDLAAIATSVVCVIAFAALTGCNSPQKYRSDTDKIAAEIIAQKQFQAAGKTTDFSIERPSDILRRRLLLDQNLQISAPASFGADNLEKIEHWPEEKYPQTKTGGQVIEKYNVSETITISLIEALQIGAQNSFEYQNRKEDIFASALALELEREAFRSTFHAQLQNLLSTDSTSSRTVSGTVQSAEGGISKKFKNGTQLDVDLAVDLASLLNLTRASSLGFAGDVSITIPLLRGSARHIVTEPLTQAQRNVIYAIWEFQRYKKEFVVDIADQYLSVLRRLDSIKNSEADYRSRIDSAKKTRRLADAGRKKEIEVDLAVQNELSARQGWIAAKQSYKKQLDSFKVFLGLPPDAKIELNPAELKKLLGSTGKMVEQMQQGNQPQSDDSDLIELIEPDYKYAGPYELPEKRAVKLAFENRNDLKVNGVKIYDAQRDVIVAADALGAELTLFGSVGGYGARRSSVSSATSDDAHTNFSRAALSSLITLDLPFDRTSEAINYRRSYISLEKTVRNYQRLEDTIKTQIRNNLRDLLEARENMYIQAKAVATAQKRVKSVGMFLEAGRAETRDLVEAQDDLLRTQNAFTSSVVNYRIAELNMQKDMGVLEVDENGLWKEYMTGGI